MLELDQKLYYLAKLVIKDTEHKDAGAYRVVASNKLGEASATVNLNFTAGDKPRWDFVIVQVIFPRMRSLLLLKHFPVKVNLFQ